MSARIRPATPADRLAIRALIWRALLYPLRLSWARFLVAEEGGTIVAAGQVRHHGDGTRELASLVVAPDRRGRGLSRQLTARLLEREEQAVYVCCRTELERFYGRFGFRPVPPADVPHSLGRLCRLEDVATRLLGFLRRSPSRLLVMKRAPSRQPGSV